VGRIKPGVVKFFSRVDENPFGFIARDDNDDVFFHGCHCVIEHEQALYVGLSDTSRRPKPGDLIYYVQGHGHKGPFALKWSFDRKLLHSYLSIHGARPAYRFIERVNGGEEVVLWEGDAIDQLKEQFPRSQYKTQTKEIQRRFMKWDARGFGAWVDIDFDPRTGRE